MGKKILRYIFIVLGVLVGVIIIFAVTVIAPVNRKPIEQWPALAKMQSNLDSVYESFIIDPATAGLSVGYSVVNLTPSFKTATAGYGNRKGKPYTLVLDSIYVRAMVVSNGSNKIAIVTADLLIIPPTVTAILEDKLKTIGFSLDNTYLGATHSHNSIGNWGEGAARFIYGKYNDDVVNFIADRIVIAIDRAFKSQLPSRLYYGQAQLPDLVENRVVKGGPEDARFRTIEVERSDSSKLIFMSFTAHATCLFSKDVRLSRDYPGRLVDVMEDKGYDFAMFMAGAVGSHKCSVPEFGETCIDWMAENISSQYLSSKQLTPVMDTSMVMVRIPLPLSDPQVKILPEWKIRSWFFRAAFGEYPAYVNAARIGDIILVGTPCDFSGEFDSTLDSAAAEYNKQLLITSFNGGYIGYLTPRAYYDIEHYETQLMNWYAPGTGEYVSNSLRNMIEIVSDSSISH